MDWVNENEKEWVQEKLKKGKHIAILTGAGISAESGIPTFRGKGGLWRTYSAMELANPEAWALDPGLVWEFYNYRRKLMEDKKPNPAHYALVQLEEWCEKEGKDFCLITQNIDDLHFEAGSKKVLPLHGSLWKVRCTSCSTVEENRDIPITPSFANSGSPDPKHRGRKFTEKDLPKCRKCQGILRPHVVWFGESLDITILEKARNTVYQADVFLIIGTSALVYPAAGLIQEAGFDSKKYLIEINLEPTLASHHCHRSLQGKAGVILPLLFQNFKTFGNKK